MKKTTLKIIKNSRLQKAVLIAMMALSLVVANPFLTSAGNDQTPPTIPQPDLLPGPDESDNQAAVQSYFRDTAIPGFIAGFLGVIAGLAVMGVIVAGVRFITSYGNEEGITAAKKMATWSVIGFGISILAYAIVSIINTLAFPEGSYEGTQQEVVDYDSI